jgi:oxalate decarboxylase/phosphoglucose isomerase-like protein (cupin superfamily)
VLDGIEHRIKPGFAILVPAGTRHNIINGPSGPMKLYTLYAPPNHLDGVVHVTNAEAEADKGISPGRRPNSDRPDKAVPGRFSEGTGQLDRP